MTKPTLKTASLVLMALFSTLAWANTPWEVEDESAASAQNEPEAVVQQPEQTNESPFAAEEEPAQMAEQPTETTQTQQQGDVLAVPQNTQAQPIAVRFLDFPRRGMTTDKVQNELGRPGEIIPAIGEPPITRWVYDDRIVYFEFSAVIHVVAR